jgi:hypothetical protein
MDGNRVLEAEGGKTLGFEVEGTLSLREPDVLDVVSKPLYKEWGSLKHSPGRS